MESQKTINISEALVPNLSQNVNIDSQWSKVSYLTGGKYMISTLHIVAQQRSGILMKS